MAKQNNNDMVLINLDRPRELRFGHKALKTYQALTGTKLEDLGKQGFDFDTIEKLIYCGLLSDSKANGEKLSIEDVEDLLDLNPIQDTIEKLSEALNNSFGKLQGDSPNMKGMAAKRK